MYHTDPEVQALLDAAYLAAEGRRAEPVTPQPNPAVQARLAAGARSGLITRRARAFLRALAIIAVFAFFGAMLIAGAYAVDLYTR